MKITTPSIIDSIIDDLKPISTPDDLINSGLAKNKKTLANMRSAGTGPLYIKLPGLGIGYPKNQLRNYYKQKV